MITPMRLADLSFRKRHRAALAVTHAGQLDGDVALSYVLWPDADDIPRDLSVFKELRRGNRHAVPKRCSAVHGEKRCDAIADPDTGLCPDHLWAFFSGEDFDYRIGEAA